MTEELDGSSEAYVMVHGPPPSEAAHIYNRFFFGLEDSTYSAATVKTVMARRAHPDLDGRLFYDDLLRLAMLSNSNENEYAEELPDPTQCYPPRAGDGDSIVELIALIQSSSFDRVKKMALWYYLILDLEKQGGRGQDRALAFANEVGLPRSARYAITGYWLLDHGDYPAAVSYLTEEPDFVPKILATISPLAYTATSIEQTRRRALALSLFLSLVDVQALELDLDESFAEARVVATCWSEGIRAAWVLSQELSQGDEDWNDDRVRRRSRCIGRIIEFCFMPTPRPDAVKALLALALSDTEEELLCHNMINSPSGIHLSAYAHAAALDVLVVRRINAGQYYDAVLLDRRINSTIGLSHLAREVATDKERDTLRRLRAKRRGLMRSAYSVLTPVERQMLTVGGQELDKSEMELSWEEIGERVHPPETPQRGLASALSRSLTPLSASPGLRKDHANETTSETFLSAVLRASPSRGKGDGRQSGTASPLSRSLLRGSPNASRSASLRLLPGDAPSQKTSRSRNGQQSSPAPGPSPLASRRPYVMTSTAETSPQAQSQIDQVPAPAPQSPQPDKEVSSDGPYSRLAQQLQDQFNDDGDLSIDRILGRKSSSQPLASGPSSDAKQAMLSFSKPVRRYEAKYEIGDTAMDGQKETNDVDLEMKEIPKRRGSRPARGKTAKRANQGGVDEDDVQDDSSLPGAFPGQTDTLPEEEDRQTKPVKKAERSPAKRRSVRSTPTTRRSAPAQEPESQGEQDDVPELAAPPSMKKSRSGAGMTNTRSSSKLATNSTTPVRRSARLSVEPENTPRAERGSVSPAKEARSRRRATSKAPSAVSASEMEETENEAESGPTTRTRSSRRAKMPGSF